MKKGLAIIAIIILIGASFFMHNKINPKPTTNQIWVEKDVSDNDFIRENSLRDTVKILEIKGSFLQVKSVAYGILFSYRLDAFVADYERCAECENIYIKNLER